MSQVSGPDSSPDAAAVQPQGPVAPPTPILTMRGIGKTFPGVVALDQVDFDVLAGEVHALMGENGAGKSTLMKILMGMYTADSGAMTYGDQPYSPSSPHDAMQQGVAMIHQELNPVLDMSVAENVFLGREIRSGLGRYLGFVDHGAMERRTAEIFDDIGIKIAPTALMRELSVAQTQLVEIAKAIAFEARLVVMDEPTSAITEAETELLFAHIARLTERGVGVVYISHKMDEIFQISDRITVLRDGRLAGTASASDLDEAGLIRLMVARDLDDVYPERQARIGDVRLRVDDLSCGERVTGVDFEVRSGEVLGIAGLVGAGRSELVETIFGLRQATSGTVSVNGRTVHIAHPKDAIRHGVALITEDRKQTGLNLAASVGENISLVALDKLSRRGVISAAQEGAAADRYIGNLRIKTPSRRTPVVSLSGGNQQKVVLAKWLLSDPDVVIFDEPTRGIDIGAKREIYLLINTLAESGTAIVMISSEMPELIGLADRIMVMCEGRKTGELSRGAVSQESIMALASDVHVEMT